MSKFVLITGSEGDIGKALVKTFFDDGFQVLGLDKSIPSNENIELMNFIKCDLNEYVKEINYRSKINSDIKKFIPINASKLVIINNAAIQILRPVDKATYEDFEASFTVNSLAPLFLTQALLKKLKISASHIVNISSIHSKLTKSNFVAYASSKAALESITRSMAIELSKYNIAINAIAPAAVNTRMLKDSFKKNLQAFEDINQAHPSKTIGNPDSLAKLTKNVVDDNSIFLTGSIIDFSGGISSLLNDPDYS